MTENDLEGHRFLRAYWYDGAFDPSHPNYARQWDYFNAVARTPGIQLRLGHITENHNPIEAPIMRAVEETAIDLGLEPSRLLAAFHRRWTFRPVRQQKGVDTLIALDMDRLAQRPVYNTPCASPVTVTSVEAIRTVQDYGARVLVAAPRRRDIAQEVVHLDDGIVDISIDDAGMIVAVPQGAIKHPTLKFPPPVC